MQLAIPKDIQAYKPVRLPAPDGFSIKVSLSPAGKSNLIFCKGKINLRQAGKDVGYVSVCIL